MLFSKESKTRELKELSGLWEFKVDKNNEGYIEKWFETGLKNTIMMPVNASYNELTQDSSICDHIGNVWYERNFFVPSTWKDQRVILRFGSVTHFATVWVNGKKVMEHKGGYLPFENEVNDAIYFGDENRVTVCVSNILDFTTIPPGRIIDVDDCMHPKGFKKQEYYHDFFNYSGIHRPVKLYTTSWNYIMDITVKTGIVDDNGIVDYKIEFEGNASTIKVRLLDEDGFEVACGDGKQGCLCVTQAKLWQPLNAYLYGLEVELFDEIGVLQDSYKLPVGIRTIKVSGKEFLINGKPFYFRGFGKHEDMELRGKGLDDATNVKDFNLLKWIGANSFRTSHYPYAEEILDMADREGIVVIDESPAVGMVFSFGNPTVKVFDEEHVGSKAFEHYLEVMRDLVNRDKNHPCVVMWSVANEPASWEEGAVKFLGSAMEQTRKMDPTRPVTFVSTGGVDEEIDKFFPLCLVNELSDVVCINRYRSWYTDPGCLELIENQLEIEMTRLYEKLQKPIIVAEYGADTIPGFHADPPVLFSEEYQCEVLRHYHNAFDRMDFIIGEHIWNFADFATKQGIIRVGGNRKGIFTRQRQPKMAAHEIKKRWTESSNLT